ERDKGDGAPGFCQQGLVAHGPLLFLANGAMKGGTAGLGRARDGTATAGRATSPTLTIVNRKGMLKVSQRAIGLNMVPERGATRSDRIGNDVTNCLGEQHELLLRPAGSGDDTSGRTPWR